MKDKTLLANQPRLKINSEYLHRQVRFREISVKIADEMNLIVNINNYLEFNNDTLGAGEEIESAEEKKQIYMNLFALEQEYKKLKAQDLIREADMRPFVLQAKLDAAKKRGRAIASIISRLTRSQLFNILGGLVNAKTPIIEKKLNEIDAENKSLLQSIANYNHYLAFDYNISASERAETNREIADFESSIIKNTDRMAELWKELCAADEFCTAYAINQVKQR